MNFIEKRISTKRAITMLSKNGIQVDHNEAAVILNFLYLIAKTYQYDLDPNNMNLKEKSNCRKIG
ncbi:hypothetical protein ABIC45_003485 [Mucilaginibacter rubeus]|nr:hypothetical protein GCM10011500_40880 [Mucilaginibacter rubeus]